MSPANENKQLCNDRKLPKLALAEPTFRPRTRVAATVHAYVASANRGLSDLCAPVADCEAWVTYGAIAKIEQ